MSVKVAMIGFGEAGQAFAAAPGWGGETSAYDRQSDDPATRAMMDARYSASGITGRATLGDALARATAAISVVTADQAAIVAQDAAQHLSEGAYFFDMNSVAPDTKRFAARAIDSAGGRYVDVAVMSPVHPARLDVPLLLSGPNAEDGAAILRALGFSRVRTLPGNVGRASSVKMIRSVMIKGIEALTAEMLLAGVAADVTDEVLASLGNKWLARADYNLDRMLVHGRRRADEMREVAKTLEALGVDPLMTRGTIERQQQLGAIAMGAPEGLSAKLELVA